MLLIDKLYLHSRLQFLDVHVPRFLEMLYFFRLNSVLVLEQQPNQRYQLFTMGHIRFAKHVVLQKFILKNVMAHIMFSKHFIVSTVSNNKD